MMNRTPLTLLLIMLGLSACAPQTIHDLIPAHQLNMMQVESYIQPEGGFLLKPDLAEPKQPAAEVVAPAIPQTHPAWAPAAHPAPNSITSPSEAISVSSMLQQTLDYAQDNKGNSK